MAGSYAGVALKVLRTNGRHPIPEPVGTSVIRVPIVNGRTLVQNAGPRIMGVTLAVKWATVGEFTTFRQRIGTGANLVLNGLTYPDAVLETVTQVTRGVKGDVTATARFTMDGY